jgi:hypothetical protein
MNEQHAKLAKNERSSPPAARRHFRRGQTTMKRTTRFAT